MLVSAAGDAYRERDGSKPIGGRIALFLVLQYLLFIYVLKDALNTHKTTKNKQKPINKKQANKQKKKEKKRKERKNTP